jgi:hypothetical protein
MAQLRKHNKILPLRYPASIVYDELGVCISDKTVKIELSGLHPQIETHLYGYVRFYS